MAREKGTPEKAEFLKGTLDMLILKVVAAGPIHGYAISQRIQQISKDFFTGLRSASGWKRNGMTPPRGGKRSFTG